VAGISTDELDFDHRYNTARRVVRLATPAADTGVSGLPMMSMKSCWGIDIDLASLFPRWPGLLSYVAYFVVGWLIFRHVDKLDQIVGATETATSDILSAAEDVQEVAWTLREQDVAPEFCDRLDQRAIDIYTACSFQDITGQRTTKVVRMLRQVEQRINAMIGAWKAGSGTETAEHAPAAHPGQEHRDLLNGPSKDGEGLQQHDVDEMLRMARDLEADSPEAAQGPEDSPESERFERPEPLTLAQLHAVKRTALFG